MIYYILPVCLILMLGVSGAVRYIPNNRLGVVERLWSFRRGDGRRGLIALSGEPGYLPDLVRGGFHRFFPFKYRVRIIAPVTIGQGKLGYVFARDGGPLDAGQSLAENRHAKDFGDVIDFIAKGGQKGPQRQVLREGTHWINLAQFVVLTQDTIHSLSLNGDEKEMVLVMQRQLVERDGFDAIRIKDGQDSIGIVTVHDGPPLPAGEIIAPAVGDEHAHHNNFQEPDQFLALDGRRGRQLQVLVEGTYYLNRLFATVEFIPKTVIEIGYAGVVVSYTGAVGTDVSGTDYRHGELVEPGNRGVWRDPLLPGKYAFNTYAGKIVAVPTTNFVLKWISGASNSLKLDENLAEIGLITKDAFEPVLPISAVVHIDYQKAPQVVQRFGDVRKLVEQTLDPMVSAYFKDIGQRKTLIELLQQRADIQTQATTEMRVRFTEYSIDLQEVLIGTPRAPAKDETIETMLAQLRQRQLAREQVETYQLQGAAATEERELNEKRAQAELQPKVTQSQIQIEVAENDGSAALARATKNADSVKVSAAAEGEQKRLVALGEAAGVVALGEANASATRQQVAAYGGPEFRLAEQIAARLFEAIAEGHQPVVPQIVVGAATGDVVSPAGLVSGLVASLLPAAAKLVAGGKQPTHPNGAAA